MTGPEVWVPAFVWLDRLTVESVFSSAEATRCNLCECSVEWHERAAHVTAHRHERAAYLKQQKRRRARENRDRLRAINRERALEKRVLGRDGENG